MRRSRIKPSINLASRRSVSGVPQGRDKGTSGTSTLSLPGQSNEETSKSNAAVSGKGLSTQVAPRNTKVTRIGDQNEEVVITPSKCNIENADNDSQDTVARSSSKDPEVQTQKMMTSQSTEPGQYESTESPQTPGTQETTPPSEPLPPDAASTEPHSQPTLSHSQPIPSQQPQPQAASSSPETGNTPSAAASRRRRFSAKPNLGQQRSRSLPSRSVGQRPEVNAPARPVARPAFKPVPRPGGKAAVRAWEGTEQKENEEELMGPPPVQRVLVAAGTQKKVVSNASPAVASSVIQKLTGTVGKKLDTTPLKVLPVPLSSPPAKPDDVSIGEGKGSEADGKQAAALLQTHQENVYSKKLKELKEQMTEETPSKRRKSHPRSTSPDRTKMTMSDLIYYNPKTNPMKISEAEKLNRKAKKISGKMDDNHEKKKVTFSEDIDQDQGDENAPVDPMAPQVKVGKNGEIIIDQSSLVVEASPARTFDPSDSVVVHEDSSSTTYSSFLKRKRTAVWTAKDTARFFKALSAVGTDFTMINALFPSRTRAEIKRKFKKEEKINRKKVDRALLEKQEFAMSLFEPSGESDEEEIVVSKKSKKKQTTTKILSLQNNPVDLDNTNLLDSAAESDVESRVSSDGAMETRDSQDDSEDQPDLNNILSTTRSGRKPKVRTSFTIEIPPKQTRKRTRASPSQGESAIKVFEGYAVSRIQRLQKEHEAALAQKQQLRPDDGENGNDDDDDGRSDATSDMMSEVGSELGSEVAEENGDTSVGVGVTNGLQTAGNNPLVGGFSSPEASLNDPSVKKIMLMITTPDGKKTLVQVNLTPSQDTTAATSSGQSAATTSGGNGGYQAMDQSNGSVIGSTPVRTPGQKIMSNSPLNSNRLVSPSTLSATRLVSPSSLTPSRLVSPVGRLTTLTTCQSPYDRNSSQRQKINTVLSQGGNQPSKQSKNVTTAKIVDGKIVFCPPEKSPSPARLQNTQQTFPTLNASSPFSTELPTMNQVLNPSLSQGSSSLNKQPVTFVHKPLTVVPPFVPSVPTIEEHRSQMGAIPSESAVTGGITMGIPVTGGITMDVPVTGGMPLDAPAVTSEPDAHDHLLAMGALSDLDVNLPLASNLDVVYDESMPLMGDPIVAQHVDVASTNPDGTLPKQKKHRHGAQEPFIPQIR